jgi:hypothetical protein
MNINLHIDSIVLDGIDLPPGQRHALHEIVAAELKMLLNTDAAHGIPSTFSDAPKMSGGPISLTGNTASLGSQLAQSVHASIAASDAGHLHNGGDPRR